MRVIILETRLCGTDTSRRSYSGPRVTNSGIPAKKKAKKSEEKKKEEANMYAVAMGNIFGRACPGIIRAKLCDHAHTQTLFRRERQVDRSFGTPEAIVKTGEEQTLTPEGLCRKFVNCGALFIVPVNLNLNERIKYVNKLRIIFMFFFSGLIYQVMTTFGSR